MWHLCVIYRIFNKNCFVKYLLLLKQTNKISIRLLYFPILLANVSFISKCLGIRFPIGNIGVLCIVTLVHIQLNIFKKPFDYFLVKICKWKSHKMCRIIWALNWSKSIEGTLVGLKISKVFKIITDFLSFNWSKQYIQNTK